MKYVHEGKHVMPFGSNDNKIIETIFVCLSTPTSTAATSVNPKVKNLKTKSYPLILLLLATTTSFPLPPILP